MTKTVAICFFVGVAVSVCSFSSCQDYEPFDFETVHNAAVARDYSKDFTQKFGAYAPNHKWGFDMASYFLNGMNPAQTRSVIKQESNVCIDGSWLPVVNLYSKPASITSNEKAEVYAWFSNHRVTWVNTPSYYVDGPTRQTTDNIAHVIKGKDAAESERYPGYGTLLDYSNPLDDYTISSTLHFHNGWVQHVNSNHNVESVVVVPKGASDEINYVNKAGYPDSVTINIDKADHMNYLYSWGLTEDGTGDWQVHLNDFNKGYGYCNPDFDGTDNNFNSHKQNAILVTDADINTWTYDSSEGSSLKHDKYFLVYLKGVDYEGWYLGFDFESWGNNTNERIKGDGICNDWIIKLNDAGATPFNPARIMCEDLGGSFDMDYNDIVFDVSYDTGGKATIAMKAAGGTIPIELYYGEKGKGGTLLTKKINGQDVSEIHALYGVDVNVPVNVKAPKGVDGKADITWVLGFNRTDGVDFVFNTAFDFQQINIYVYHDDVAEWVNLGNIDGSAPYKICTPHSVRWMQETKTIDWSYPLFRDWVANPTVLFWNDPSHIDTQYLY